MTNEETIYGVGIRLSEAPNLRVQDIDSGNMRLFAHHGNKWKEMTLIADEFI